MNLRFWGTRGSIAAPGRGTIELGGNTSCMQLLLDKGKYLIFNSGTGIIEMATNSVDAKKDKEFHIFLSNFSWDLIQGFPFFFPIHDSKSVIHVYSPWPVYVVKSNFVKLFDGSYSPLRDMSNLAAEIHFHKIEPKGMELFGCKIEIHESCHPAQAYAYRVTTPEGEKMISAIKHENQGDALNDRLVKFSKGAKIMVHNGQYTADMYVKRAGRGNSSIEAAVANAVAAGVKKLIITCHDPANNDDTLRVYMMRFLHTLRKEHKKLPEIELAWEFRPDFDK